MAKYYPYLLTKYMPAVTIVGIAVEGVIMTFGELRRIQMVRDGEQRGIRKGRQEALDQAIRKLEASGQEEAARILRSQNGE